MNFPPEILKKVKLIEISTRKLVNNVFQGEYRSAFRGQGMTFSEFREYVPGDDVRDISWSVSARTGRTHIKLYDEERELTNFIVVDISGSGDFGSGDFAKGEVIVHLAALLGYSAAKNNDKVGLLCFSDQIEKFVPPKKGIAHVHRILRDLLFHKPQSKKTDMRVAIEHLITSLRKRANIFIISDFISTDYERSLKLLGRKHDVTAILVRDDLEIKLPNIGIVNFFDPETGEDVYVDTSSKMLVREYEKEQSLVEKKRLSELRKAEVQLVEIKSSADYVDPLIAYFRRRNLKG